MSHTLILRQKKLPESVQEEIRSFIEADSLGYLSLEDLESAMHDEGGKGFCYACFSGHYPVPPPPNGKAPSCE